jgi:hypothetical protein
LVKNIQEQDILGATSIDKDSDELYILDDGIDDERVPPLLWYKVQVVAAIEGDGDLRPL